MFKKIISILVLFSVSLTASATYVYEANQNLFNLVNEQNTTNMAASDDGVSSVFNLDFTFTFYGQDFTMARMATNGCLHFWKSGSSGYCNDYTPDPLPEITYTLYPFWTDLIRDNGSKVLAKNFTDKAVFGWYNLREYNRSGSDNSFEVILWPNNTFEYRYGGLDIINHDVLIGEQGTSSELYTYLFHDECSTGTTNSSSCVNTNWNSTASNTLLENGGSLYGLGSGNVLDCSSPLNNTACVGYAAAYLTQQCDMDGLYSTQCPNYWDDLFDYECSYDTQYSPACPGYMVETYEVDQYEEDMYGYDDDMYGYEEDMYGYDSYEGMEFTDEEWYEIDLEEFGQEQVNEWYGTEVAFNEEGMLDWETVPYDTYEEVDVIIELYDIEQEEHHQEEFITFDYIEEVYEEVYVIEDIYEELYVYELDQTNDLPELGEEIIFNHFEHEQLIEVFEEEPSEFLDFENIEELEEWFQDEVLEEETIEETEELIAEEEIEAEEEVETEEELLETETSVVENKDKRRDQLNIVQKTIQTAAKSMSGTTSGTSVHSTATSVAAGSTGAVQSSTGGVSMSNSPSISAQVSSSAAQTQQILTEVMSPTTTGNVGIGTVSTFTSTETVASTETVGSTETSVDSTAGPQESNDTSVGSTSTVVASNETTTDDVMNTTTAASNVSVQTQTVETQIETAVADTGSTTDTDQLVAQIVANNVKVQQEEMEEQQAETGEYADSSALIGFMAYVPGFTAYRQVDMPDQTMWYQPKAIYGNVSISDNNSAFFGMYSTSLKGINELKQMQPNL